MKLERGLLLLVFWLCCLSPAAAGESMTVASLEQLKAAILFNFGRYVEWPAEALPTPETPIRFCIGNDRAVKESLSAQTARRLKEHPIAVISLEDSEAQALKCHVAYIAKGSHLRKNWLESASNASTLLITEDEVGVIRLVRDDARLAFEVYRKRAEQAGLTLSSHLLRLARAVHEDVEG